MTDPPYNVEYVGKTADALTSGEQVLSVDVDINTVRDVPQPVTIWTATLSIAGSTTTA